MPIEYGSNFEMVNSIGDATSLVDSSNTIYLRTAREAILYICKSNKLKTVLMPALCCASMVQPFLQSKIEVRYYKMKNDLTIDYVDLCKKLKDDSFVFVMHYYGVKTFDFNTLQDIVQSYSNIQIIQDCTQHIFTKSLYNDIADYWIGSIRKWVSIADGAFLSSKKHKLHHDFQFKENDEGFVETTVQAMQLKQQYLSDGDENIKKLYREKFGNCMTQLKGKIVVHSMSDISRRMFYNTVDCVKVRNVRTDNYNVLYEQLKCDIPEILEYSSKYVGALCLNIVVSNQNKVQQKLASKGIYCQVLWPLNKEAQDTCEFSKWYAEHMLAVPCDQRYGVEDMLIISDELRKVIRGE